MGVKSFRTGTGQKRLATEKGLYRGRAEYFYSTRRTGLTFSPRPPLANQYTLRIPYHAYGDTIGTFSVGFAPSLNEPYEVLEFLKDGSSTPITSFSGQQQTSSLASWGYVDLEVPDGILYVFYISGSNFTGDFAIDTVTVSDITSGAPLGTIPTTSSWERNTSAGETDFHDENDTAWTFMGTSSTAINGTWNLDSNGTGSTGTGPSSNSTGSTTLQYIYAETSGAGFANKYFTLRTFDLISTYI